MDVLHKIPLLRIVVFFVVGIAINLIGVNYKFSLLGFVFGAFMLLLYFLVRSQENRFSYRWIFGFAVSVISVSAGLLFMHKNEHQLAYDSQYFVGKVIDAPKEGEKSVCCVMSLSQKHSEMNATAQTLKAVVFLPKDERSSSLLKGDSLALFCNDLSDYKIDDRLPVSSFQADLESADASFYIRETDWVIISHKNTSFAVSRDSLLSMLKKKD